MISLEQAPGILIQCDPPAEQSGTCWLSKSGVKLGEVRIREGKGWLPTSSIADDTYDLTGWGPDWAVRSECVVRIPEDLYSRQNLRVVVAPTVAAKVVTLLPDGMAKGDETSMAIWSLAGDQREELRAGPFVDGRPAWQMHEGCILVRGMEERPTPIVVVLRESNRAAAVTVTASADPLRVAFGSAVRSTVRGWKEIAAEQGLVGVVQEKSTSIEVGVPILDRTEWFRVDGTAMGFVHRNSRESWTFARDPELDYRLVVLNRDDRTVIPISWE